MSGVTDSETARLQRVQQQREYQVSFLLQLVRDNFANGDEVADTLVPLLHPRVTFSQDVPTRRNRLGIADSDQKTRDKDTLPVWLRCVVCPRCGLEMTPLKAKAEDQWGEAVTYQCHNKLDGERFCLTVVTVTTGVGWFMRAGDFTSSDYDWHDVAPQTIPASTSPDDPEKVERQPFIPVEKPPTWERNTIYKPIYDAFWNDIFTSGRSDPSVLVTTGHLARPNNSSGKIIDIVDVLPQWMKARTGYEIRKISGQYEVAGKSVGSLYEWPYSDPVYRKVHEFPD